MRLLDTLRPARAETRMTIDDYAGMVNQFAFNGTLFNGGIQQTLAGGRAEHISSDFIGLAQSAYSANGVVFSCMLVRMMLFSTIRFQYQRLAAGRPSELFGDKSLGLLETPWPGGTTQDMLVRMIQDADLAGNAYWTARDGELIRLRPDWVGIVLEPRVVGRNRVLGFRRVGYTYTEGGTASGYDPELLPLDEVAHFAPLPDPLATYRGMSWLTPVIREIQNDGLMSRHKRKFFENGATPNMVVKLSEKIGFDAFKRFKAEFDADHRGVENAYQTLFLGGGADATVVGADFEQMDFKTVQGHGETRIAAAAGIAPVIVGLSEGLEAATYSNYAQARRRTADGTMHPLWQNAAGTMQQIRPAPPGTRLWYDTRDVPFLREDEKDQAEIQGRQAQTIRTLVDGGYTADSVIRAVLGDDFGLLSHSGLFSVQLQPAGSGNPTSEGATGA